MSPFLVQVLFFDDLGTTFDPSLGAYGQLFDPFVHAFFSSFFHRFLAPPGHPFLGVGGCGGTPLIVLNVIYSVTIISALRVLTRTA